MAGMIWEGLRMALVTSSPVVCRTVGGLRSVSVEPPPGPFNIDDYERRVNAALARPAKSAEIAGDLDPRDLGYGQIVWGGNTYVQNATTVNDYTRMREVDEQVRRIKAEITSAQVQHDYERQRRAAEESVLRAAAEAFFREFYPNGIVK
jgi:hypothetical protein